MSATATIAVNAAIVGQRPTGLGITTLQMINALDALGECLTVFTSCPEAVEAKHARVVRVSSLVRPERGAAGHLARLVWIETALRWHVRRARPAVSIARTTACSTVRPEWSPSLYRVTTKRA